MIDARFLPMLREWLKLERDNDRALAIRFKVNPSMVHRWATESAIPGRHAQRQIISWINVQRVEHLERIL